MEMESAAYYSLHQLADVGIKRDGDILFLDRQVTATTAGKTASSSATASATTKTTRFETLRTTTIAIPEGFAKDPGTLINALLSVIMVIAAILVFFQLIYAGFSWITAGGDKGKTDSARQRILSALVGLIVVSASYALFTIVLNFLGYASINELLENTRTISP